MAWVSSVYINTKTSMEEIVIKVRDQGERHPPCPVLGAVAASVPVFLANMGQLSCLGGGLAEALL